MKRGGWEGCGIRRDLKAGPDDIVLVSWGASDLWGKKTQRVMKII